MNKESYIPACFQHNVATLNQAAPIQDQWYNILAATPNVRVYQVSFEVLTTNETLEVRIIIDGVTYTATQIAVAGTDYYFMLNMDPTGLQASVGTPVQMILLGAANDQGLFIEGRSVQIQMRKTTAAGAGNLRGAALYGRR